MIFKINDSDNKSNDRLKCLYYKKSKSMPFRLIKDTLVLYEFYEQKCNDFFIYKEYIIICDYLEELAELIIKDSKQAILNKNHSSMNIKKLCQLKIKYNCMINYD